MTPERRGAEIAAEEKLIRDTTDKLQLWLFEHTQNSVFISYRVCALMLARIADEVEKRNNSSEAAKAFAERMLKAEDANGDIYCESCGKIADPAGILGDLIMCEMCILVRSSATKQEDE
jgi:hypothetical protein